MISKVFTGFLFLILFSCNSQSPSEFSINPKKGSAPGIGFYEEDLQEKLQTLYTKRAKSKYQARTKHKDKKGNPDFINRLFMETSPYLLQHAHNPVNWFPWGEKAFSLAKKLNRPVLLSVGYSTCHWCHVMEEESFEDLEIAKYLNQNYISIKVDREERPDVDTVYMAAVTAITGRGGWPMTVWLTPDKKPIYGGTYFPARDGQRGARLGFLSLIKKFNGIYKNESKKVSDVSNKVRDAIKQSLEGEAQEVQVVSDKVLHDTFKYFKNSFDPINGGVKRAPKFPSTFPVKLLLRYAKRFNNKKSLSMATKTLNRMAAGGIYDQIGGGFHRYSTDRTWLVPHFEKMLYDNGLLASLYTEAYVATKNRRYKVLAMEILDYILREMTNKEDLFFSATDADSLTDKGHREEGYYFSWSKEDLKNDLGEKLFKKAQKLFSISKSGNYEGRNILKLKRFNDRFKYKEDFKTIQNILIKTRENRKRPLRDDKALVSWNALVISALAQAGFYFNEKKYSIAAHKAATTISKKLIINGSLHRVFNNGRVKINAFLDDYTFLIQALLDLYEYQSNEKWLNLAINLDETLENEFEDVKNGGFYSSGTNHEKLIARQKKSFDGAIPTGNSIAYLNLQRMYLLTGFEKYHKRANRLLSWFSAKLNRNPMSLSEMLLGVEFNNAKTKEIILLTPKGQFDLVTAFLDKIRKNYKPNKVISIVESGSKNLKNFPILEGKMLIDNKVTAFVCERGICQLPTIDLETFSKQIK